jgi:membrane protein DedA with SNARE-associated domain
MRESIISFLRSADPFSLYISLFLISFFKNFIPFLPLDIFIALIGFMLFYTKLNIFMAIFWPSFGSTLGFISIYILFRKFGNRIFEHDNGISEYQWLNRIYKRFPKNELTAVRMRFSKYGYFAVLINRFLLGSRSLISPVIGLMNLNAVMVFIAAGLSATAWNSLLIYGGYYLGNKWEKIGLFVEIYTVPITVVFFLMIIIAVIKYIRERKAELEGEKAFLKP